MLLTQDSSYKKGFKFDHVWNVLKDCEKFSNATTPPQRQSSTQSYSPGLGSSSATSMGYFEMASNTLPNPERQQSVTIHNTGQQSTPTTHVMPQILLLLETTDTVTDNNDDTMIYTSIRCNRSTGDDTSPSAPESSNKKKNTRGPIRGERVLKHVALHGKIRVVFEENMKASKQEVHDSLVRIVGAFVRSEAPMNVPCYGKLLAEFKPALYNHLSTQFDIVHDNPKMDKYIDDMARDTFKEWKYECRKRWKKEGDAIPKEFKNRKDQWVWLLHHFKDEDSKKKSKQMTEARQSENKKNHTLGPTLFGHRADKKRKEGCLAPNLSVFVEYYRKDDPDTTEKVEVHMNAAIEDFVASQPHEPFSDGTT